MYSHMLKFKLNLFTPLPNTRRILIATITEVLSEERKPIFFLQVEGKWTLYVFARSQTVSCKRTHILTISFVKIGGGGRQNYTTALAAPTPLLFLVKIKQQSSAIPVIYFYYKLLSLLTDYNIASPSRTSCISFLTDAPLEWAWTQNAMIGNEATMHPFFYFFTFSNQPRSADREQFALHCNWTTAALWSRHQRR